MYRYFKNQPTWWQIPYFFYIWRRSVPVYSIATDYEKDETSHQKEITFHACSIRILTETYAKTDSTFTSEDTLLVYNWSLYSVRVL